MSVAPSLLIPTDAINRLSEALKYAGESFTLEADKLVTLAPSHEERAVYLFTQGKFIFIRSDDGLHLGAGNAPAVFGLTEILQYRGKHQIITASTCNGRKISAIEARNLINTNGLWEDVAVVMAYLIHILTVRDEQLIGTDAYTMICHKLKELMAYPEEQRKRINVQRYIQHRTFLSKSIILRILSSLREGGYLKIESGCLICINKLPIKY